MYACSDIEARRFKLINFSELLKKKLLEWLPKEKLDAKYKAFLERKKVFKTR